MKSLGKGIRTIGVADILTAVCLIGALAMQMLRFADDPGVGWHLKVGESILRDGIFPFRERFIAGPAAGKPWIADQWLADALFFKLYDRGGYLYLYAGLAIVYFWSFLGFFLPAVRRITGSHIASCFAVLFAFKISQVHFILRPTVLSFAFFIPLCVVISKIYELKNIKGAIRRPFILLPAMFAVWANTHGGFSLGLILILCLPLGLILDRLMGERSGDWELEKSAMLIFAACLGATLINPHGIRLHQGILELGQSKYFMGLHMEWQSPNFREPEGQFWEILMFVPVLSFVLFPRQSGERIGFYSASLLVFAYLSLQAVRVLPYLGIAAAIPWTLSVIRLERSESLLKFNLFRNFLPHFSWLSEREKRSFGGAGVYILMALLAFYCFRESLLMFGPQHLGPSSDKYPYAALSALVDRSQSSPSVAVAEPDWGGFITWYGKDRVKAVIDDRNLLFGEQYYRDFYDNLKVGRDLEPFLARLGATHLLLKADSALGSYLEKQGSYKLMYKDSVALLFELGKKS